MTSFFVLPIILKGALYIHYPMDKYNHKFQILKLLFYFYIFVYTDLFFVQHVSLWWSNTYMELYWNDNIRYIVPWVLSKMLLWLCTQVLDMHCNCSNSKVLSHIWVEFLKQKCKTTMHIWSAVCKLTLMLFLKLKIFGIYTI